MIYEFEGFGLPGCEYASVRLGKNLKNEYLFVLGTRFSPGTIYSLDDYTHGTGRLSSYLRGNLGDRNQKPFTRWLRNHKVTLNCYELGENVKFSVSFND
jgi:hypothetical protein